VIEMVNESVQQVHTIGEVSTFEGVSLPHAHRIVKQSDSLWKRIGRNQYVRRGGEDQPINFAEWRAFEKREAALIRAIERQKLEGEVILTTTHLALVDAIYSATRSAFLAMPNNLTPQLVSANTPAKLKNSLESHARSCLVELAETLHSALGKLETPDPDAPAPDQTAASTTAPLRRRVGRPRKGTQP
jgi:hypothetical protein